MKFYKNTRVIKFLVAGAVVVSGFLGPNGSSLAESAASKPSPKIISDTTVPRKAQLCARGSLLGLLFSSNPIISSKKKRCDAVLITATSPSPKNGVTRFEVVLQGDKNATRANLTVFATSKNSPMPDVFSTTIEGDDGSISKIQSKKPVPPEIKEMIERFSGSFCGCMIYR